jgi:hypothetical protein
VSITRSFALTPALVTAVVAVFGMPTLATAQCFVAKLAPEDGGPLAYHAWAVALDGDWALVSADDDSERGRGAGAAYVFRRDASGRWMEHSKLLASDGGPGDNLALRQISIYDDSILLGAPGWDGVWENQGAAYLFKRDPPSTWQEVEILTASDGQRDDVLGGSALVLDAVGFAGAPGYGFAGAAYAFEDDGGRWFESAKLVPVGATLNSDFGRHTAYDSGVFVAGAESDQQGPAEGAVFVFERGQDDRWVQKAKLKAPDGAQFDYLGASVAISGDTIVAGAYNNDEREYNAGAVYVWVRDAQGSWRFSVKIMAEDGAFRHLFGWSVALEDDLLAVGALAATEGSIGTVYLYRRVAPATWVPAGRLYAPDGRRDDFFGWSLGLKDGMLIVGAPFHDLPGGEDSGAAYIFDLTRGPHGAPDGRGGDINKDGVTDLEDYKLFVACLTGPETPVPNLCLSSRLDCDDDADLADFAILQQHLAGP